MQYRLKKDLPWAKVGETVEEFGRDIAYNTEIVGDEVRNTSYSVIFIKKDCFQTQIPEYLKSEWLEEVDERWKPMEGERFFLVEAGGRVAFTKYQGCKYDDTLVDFGNCFKTEELAERAAEQIKALLKEFHKNNK